MRQRRVQQAKRKGVNLPEYLQDEAPKVVGMVQSAMTDDLVGALRLVGCFTEDELQEKVDCILDHQ